MTNTKRKTTKFTFGAILSGMLLLGACGYEKNETDYENEIEAAENEVGDPMLRKSENLSDTTESDQPARIDGQEGHPAPSPEKDDEYKE